jgi:hypothetical protein
MISGFSKKYIVSVRSVRVDHIAARGVPATGGMLFIRTNAVNKNWKWGTDVR